ncbi:tetratricopeptide repeat protein [Streptosporangiaceae bacterium NEAU-GS5]|nr:tetratricopeptide repeat protein [Streptosporangiaceae bacterium NEAU-GS5]
MEFYVLGSLQVTDDGRPVSIGGAAKVRRALAALLSRAGYQVSTDWLITAVWDDVPPTSARRNLQLYVHRLRRTLGGERIAAHTDGYSIDVAGRLDALRFRELAAAGTSALDDGDAVTAARTLRAALDLWRGPAFAEFADSGPIAEEAGRLELLRLGVYERWAEAELALGRHGSLVPELVDLVAGHPYRENLRAQLMLALYHSGRQDEALRAYREGRALLNEQLGVEPGPRLRRLHEAMLRGDAHPERSALAAAFPRVPRELPPDLPGFVGRAEAVRALDAMSPDSGPIVISSISGTAGVGKTALAVHWAHRIAHRFPDGQLYANLRGFDPSGEVADPAAIAREFLDAFAIPADRIPADATAQINLYRSLLADKRVLVLLDNARDADQVRPLLPGSYGSKVVVTSRTELTGLVVTQGAQRLALDLMTADEARGLLARRLGTDRVAAEPEAADEIADLCARLPLALAVIAARAAARPADGLAVIATELREAQDRLAVFAGQDAATDVRAVLSWSYRSLDPPAARLFRLLGLHPGPEICMASAASLAAIPVSEARPLLAELTRASLINEPSPGRYAFHDLLRAYASELAAGDDDQGEALGRMADHYVHGGHGAALLLNPARTPIDLDRSRPGTVHQPLHASKEALDWFGAEHQVLVAMVDLAVARGLDRRAWQLAWTLTSYFDWQGHWRDQLRTSGAALSAAVRLGDPYAQAHMYRGLARAHTRLREYAAATANYEHALELYVTLGDQSGQADILNNLAGVFHYYGRDDLSLQYAERALAIYTSTGDLIGQARCLNDIGYANALLGRYDEAVRHCRRALERYQDLDDPHGEADAWDSLGYAYHNLGEHQQAIDAYQAALAAFEDSGDRANQAATLDHLGDSYEASGRRQAARDAWSRAYAIYDDLGFPDADRLRAKL